MIDGIEFVPHVLHMYAELPLRKRACEIAWFLQTQHDVRVTHDLIDLIISELELRVLDATEQEYLRKLECIIRAIASKLGIQYRIGSLRFTTAKPCVVLDIYRPSSRKSVKYRKFVDLIFDSAVVTRYRRHGSLVVTGYVNRALRPTTIEDTYRMVMEKVYVHQC